MVSTTFQTQNSQLFPFLSKLLNYLLVIFLTETLFVDSQTLCTHLTNSQPIPGWECSKSNSQQFPKFPTGMRILLNTQAKFYLYFQWDDFSQCSPLKWVLEKLEKVFLHQFVMNVYCIWHSLLIILIVKYH